MPTLSRALLGVLVLISSLSAQRTWIVDPSGNGDFRDLPPALIAASDGDVIVLRAVPVGYYPLPGYTTATTNKGVTILGEAGARFATSPTNTSPFTVTGLPAGKAFVLAGVTFSNPLPYAIALNGCVGAVHIERVTATTGGATLRIQGCRQVAVCNSSLTGSTAVQIENGAPDVALVDCALVSDGNYSMRVYGPSTAPRILVSGGSTLGTISGEGPSTATLTIAGGRATTIAAPNGSTGVAVQWFGPLTIDPTAQIIGTIQGSQPVMQRIPALSALGAPPGQPIRSSIRSPSGDVAVLLLSVPIPRTPTPPFGDLWIDPALIFFATGGVQGAGEQLDIQIPTPTSAPRGILLGLQALAGTGIDLRLSNPSVVVIN